MPELAFKLNAFEKIEMYKFLFEKGCTFILEIQYLEQKYIEFTNLEDMIGCGKQFESYHILHKDYQRLPLEMSNVVKNPNIGDFYYLIPRTGGPSINISSFKYQETEKHITIVTDDLHHYPDYWTKDLSGHFRVPEELKSMYKEIEKYIKKRTKKIKLLLEDGKSFRNFYISKLFFEEAKAKNKKLFLWENELNVS